ncbi:translation elongation factor Ts [Peredibacter starrii]|uniref:Elongation factor Ts n=1 Tax=Peredibacter starrii TaxID=28202 RepID=A0AAX4HQQ9_9BACT|nr:translation elongation factor Ts [Peredibacter starrii]WPU65639.1 translation elongation factor Ts [Peredibacter starrii]
MAYTAADVKNLRETTGAGMMDCKKALDETGDFQKAVDYLRAKGLAAAAKKQSRIAAEGVIAAVVTGKVGALVEVNCETDFVAKNDEFQKFATNAAALAVETQLSNVDQFLTAKSSNGLTIKDNISELTIKIGEKIDVRRVEVMKLEGNGMIGSYVHSGKIGVLCRVESDKDVNGNEAFQTLVKDLCMQIAAANPQFLNASEIDETYKAKEAEIYAAQLKEQGKPEAMIPNIVKGKLAKLASEVCLYEQSFVKDPDTTIGKLIEATGKTAGASIKVTKFIKLNLGEGIEKKSENFAEEIAKLTGKN